MMNPVLPTQESHEHICPLCSKTYYCTDNNCENKRYVMCKDCFGNETMVQ